MKNARRLGVLMVAVFILLACFDAFDLFADHSEVIIKITAKKFEYSPNEITIEKGVPVILELTTLDRLHGFNCPGLSIRADIIPGKVNRVNFVPQNTGTFEFHCDIFCGEGHENMTGKILVTK